jgi:peptidoglycan/LPS O-acetylase OafA/YrhL
MPPARFYKVFTSCRQSRPRIELLLSTFRASLAESCVSRESFMQRVTELDGLRAVAILAVFMCHFVGPNHAMGPLGLGWTGVDLFFAISGFLITSILLGLRTQESPYKTFYWRRVLRIAPPYYAVLTITLLLSLAHHEHVSAKDLVRYGLFLSSAEPNVVKMVFVRLLTGSHIVAPAVPFTPVRYVVPGFEWTSIYWTLSVEELFYLLWAPVMLRGTRRTILLFCVAPLLVCPILRGLAHSPFIGEYFGFVFRFDSLAAGGCVALLFIAVKEGSLKAGALNRGLLVTAIVSLLGLLLVLWYCDVARVDDVRSALTFGMFGYSLLATFFAAVVGICVQYSGRSFLLLRALRSGAAVRLGTVSYMMYLTHMTIYALVEIALLRFLGPSKGLEMLGTGPWPLLVRGSLATVLTIAVASLSWKYFESPILRLKDKRFPDLARRKQNNAIPQAA